MPYSKGVIAIPEVSGDVEIQASAIEDAPAYTNWLLKSYESMDVTSGIYNNGTGHKDGYRYNSSHAEAVEQSGKPAFITGFIPVSAGDTVRLSGSLFSGVDGGKNVCFFDSSGTYKFLTNPHNWSISHSITSYEPYDYDSQNQILHSFTVPASVGQNGWMALTLAGHYSDGDYATVNEEV